MKKLLYIILILPYFATAQEKIEGIGVFKIGKTRVTYINDLSVQWNTKVYNYDGYDFLKQYVDPRIFGIKPDSSYAGYELPILSPAVQVFFMPFYEVAGIKIEKAYLVFYNGILISFRSDTSTELRNALTTKYGSAQTERTSKSITCIYKVNGNKIQEDEITFTDKWVNGPVFATYYFSNFHDSDCKQHFKTYFWVENEPAMKKAIQEHLAISRPILLKAQSEKKKKLSDF